MRSLRCVMHMPRNLRSSAMLGTTHPVPSAGLRLARLFGQQHFFAAIPTKNLDSYRVGAGLLCGRWWQ